MKVTFGENEIELTGNTVKLGDIAEDVTLIDQSLAKKQLLDFKSDFIVISVVPSLDTGVCSYQTKTFNEKLSKKKNVTVLTLSNDLPFAQKRWCGNEGLQNVITLSDHVELNFAQKYGVLMEPLRLLARAVFVLNNERKVIYKEIVPNVSEHPSYDEVVKVIEEYK